jgi:hypothetical protein
VSAKEDFMKMTRSKAATGAKFIAFGFACAAQAGDSDKEKQQKQIREMAQDTLQRLLRRTRRPRA